MKDALGRVRSDDYHYAFSPDEYAAICEAADGLTTYLGRGWSALPDREFAGQVVRVLARTGIHPSRIGSLGMSNLRDDVLTWPRPKTREWPWVPVHHELAPWIENFLSKTKPRNRSSYTRILRRVERQISETEEVSIHLNPLRFRHFAAHTFLVEMQLPVPVVCDLLRVTPKMLRPYSNQGPDYLRELLRARGW
jgi:hypothetical protein